MIQFLSDKVTLFEDGRRFAPNPPILEIVSSRVGYADETVRNH